MSLRQFNKLLCKPTIVSQYRILSTTKICSNSVGYGDLWDYDHDCPDHGHFSDNPNKTHAGETIEMDPGLYAKYVSEDYEKSLTDVDEILRRHSMRTHSMMSVNMVNHEPDTGNGRSARGYN